MFGLKRFHLYLYGRHFTILTDHKALERIFGPKTAIPSLAVMRLQRWAIILSAFDYSIRFVPSKQNAVADALSRLPLPSTLSDENAFFKVEELLVDSLPITHKEISHATQVDPVLSKVLEFVRHGWPQHIEDIRLNPISTFDLNYPSSKVACYGGYESSSLPAIKQICWKNCTRVIQALSG